jgi:hypothetical protein
MGKLATGEPVWDLQFDEKGNLTAPGRAAFLDEVAGSGVEHLFVFSHGWGTSQQHATRLYNAMFPLIRAAAHGVLSNAGFAGIYWPSLWFPPAPATVPAGAGTGAAGAAAATQSAGSAAVPLNAGTAAVTGAEIAASLQDGYADADQRKAITQIGDLIDQGEAMLTQNAPEAAQEQLITEISQLIGSLAPSWQDAATEDRGETRILTTTDPKTDYPAIAAQFGTTPPGGATQGIGNWFGSAINGAKDAVRALSFWTMKTRAGTIGQTGLGPLLADLHQKAPAVRVHLVGHSFGARLVSFALAGLGSPADSPVRSVTLLQGAFSHWSFSGGADNPFGAPGGLYTRNDRVNGPLVATFSGFDWAVGVWYPRAAFLVQSNLQGEDPVSRWGGLGADGFQPAGAATTVSMPAGGGLDYPFTPGGFYRVDANQVIDNTTNESFSGAHSDIQKAPVAQLIVAAARAGEG